MKTSKLGEVDKAALLHPVGRMKWNQEAIVFGFIFSKIGLLRWFWGLHGTVTVNILRDKLNKSKSLFAPFFFDWSIVAVQ